MSPPEPARRRFLHRATHLTAMAAASAALPMVSSPARAAMRGERRLSLVHTHTRERVALTFARDEQYVPEALATLNRFLRDHYTGDVGTIDPQLFDLLHRVQLTLGTPADDGAFEIISGYRCPITNARLRQTGGGGVATRSLHMDGKAIDIRLPGQDLKMLHKAAMSLRGGGVGYYADSQFVHMDTGRVRYW
jgi:uncharacterized protein YcbK (DUF882 family)